MSGDGGDGRSCYSKTTIHISMSIYGTYGKRCPLVATIIAVAREDERQEKKKEKGRKLP